MEVQIDGRCDSLWSQARGLMFSRKKTLLFDFGKEKKTPLHNWFVFFPIYVYFLDESFVVVEKGHMQPFGFFSPRAQARYLVESPVDLGVGVGSRLSFGKTL